MVNSSKTKYGCLGCGEVFPKRFNLEHARDHMATCCPDKLTGPDLQQKCMLGNSKCEIPGLARRREEGRWEIYVGNVPPGSLPSALLAGVNNALNEASFLEGPNKHSSPSPAVECRVIKQYAFLTFLSEADAEWAIQCLQGLDFGGRALNVPGPPIKPSEGTTAKGKNKKMNKNDSDMSNDAVPPRDVVLSTDSMSAAIENTLANLTKAEMEIAEGLEKVKARERELKLDRNVVEKARKEQEDKIHYLKSELGKVKSELRRSNNELLTEKEKVPSLGVRQDLEIHRLKSELGKVNSELRRSESNHNALLMEREKVPSLGARQDKEIHRLKSELGKVSSELRRSESDLDMEREKVAERGLEISAFNSTMKVNEQILRQELRIVNEELRLKDELLSMLKTDYDELEARKRREDPDTIQLRALLKNSEAKVKQLETQLAQTNLRVEQAKADFISANANVIQEKKKRETVEQKLQKKTAEVKVKQKAPKSKSKLSHHQVPDAPSLTEFIALPGRSQQEKSESGISVLKRNQAKSGSNSRQSELASLVDFEATHRERTASGEQSSSPSPAEAEERRNNELELIQAAYTQEEVQVVKDTSSMTTISRQLLLSLDTMEQSATGGIGIDFSISTSNRYLLYPEFKAQVNASISSPSHTASETLAGTAKQRELARQSLGKLLASCRWEAELNRGEESIFAVLVCAESWVRNEWPEIMKQLSKVDESEDHSTSDEGGKDYSFCRMLIYSHHMYDPEKVKVTRSFASNCKVGGYVKTGTPAFILLEGLEENCQGYAQDLIQYRGKMNDSRHRVKDTSTFSVLGKTCLPVRGMDGFNEMSCLPSKMEELGSDEMAKFKSACVQAGLGEYLEDKTWD